MPYFLFFYSFLFSIVVLSFSQSVHSKDQRILSILLLSFLLLTFCFSYQHGVDWLAYYKDYYGIESYQFEIGYKFISSTFKNIGVNFWVMSAGIKFFLIFSLYLMLKKFQVPYIPVVLVFFIIINYHLTSNVLRQDVALAFVFIGFLFIAERIKYTICFILFASLFHISAVTVLLSLIVYKFNAVRKFAIFFIPILLTMALLKVSIFGWVLEFIKSINIYPFMISKLIAYFSQDALPISFGMIIRLFLFFISSVFFYKLGFGKTSDIKSSSRVLIVFTYSLMLTSILIELVFFQTRTVVVRLNLYYSVFFIILPMHLLFYFNTVKIMMVKIFFITYMMLSAFSLSQKPFFYDFYINYNNYLYFNLKPDFYEESDKAIKVNKFWDSYVPP